MTVCVGPQTQPLPIQLPLKMEKNLLTLATYALE